jgi:hypothetical protein
VSASAIAKPNTNEKILKKVTVAKGTDIGEDCSVTLLSCKMKDLVFMQFWQEHCI